MSPLYIRDGSLGQLTLTSTCEILPMTLFCASKTGIEDTPSLCMSSRAVARGLSPLCVGQSRACEINCWYSLDGQNLLLADIQILEKLWVQLVHEGEACPVLPEELNQPQLSQYTNNIRGAFVRNEDSMHAAAEHLHSFGQICCVWEGDEWLLFAQVLDILEGYGLSFASLLRQLIEGGDILLFGVGEADYEEKICIQIAVVEGADCMA